MKVMRGNFTMAEVSKRVFWGVALPYMSDLWIPRDLYENHKRNGYEKNSDTVS
jgi:hypothetical protein